MKILITGGAGFIGHHIVEDFLVRTGWDVLVLDKLTYASNGFNRLRDMGRMSNAHLFLYPADFTQKLSPGLIKEMGDVNYIIHLGAETHVDNSIADAEPFVMSNVVGTMRMLDYARKLKNLKQFIYFSTDEVFGPASDGRKFKEWDRYNSGNPYSASKAGGEELCLAYANTFGLPIVITQTMNAFGERQHPEKFIPLVIRKILNGDPVKIHSDKTKTRPGCRSWIHCRNIANAVSFLIDRGQKGDKYNIVGEREFDNLQMAMFIANVMGKRLEYELVDFHSTRPGHDLRYDLDGTKMKDMGWHVPKNFEESLTKTVEWYLKNPGWLWWSDD